MAENITEEQYEQLGALGWSEEQIQNESSKTIEYLLMKLAIPDIQGARIEAMRESLIGDDGTIDYDARFEGHMHIKRMKEKLPYARKKTGGMPSGAAAMGGRLIPQGTSAGLHHDNAGWISLGPHNVGGRTRSIVIDNNNPQRIYLGSAKGGVWITEDGGQNWYPTEDLMASLEICSLVMDPTDSKVLYVGTGDFKGKTPGAGIFKSEDGWSWTLLEATKVTNANKNFDCVLGLAISRDGKVLLAATQSGLYRWECRLANGKDNPDKNWQQVSLGRLGCVFFDPNDSSKAIAAGDGRIEYSADGGKSWTAATMPGFPDSPRIQLTYALSDSSIVFASMNTGTTEVWQSTDGGRSFVKRQSRAAENMVGNSNNTIWAYDSNLVIVGGLDLWRSTDGGDSFTKISKWQSAQRNFDSAHADHHTIVPHPEFNNGSNKTVYFGNDGGIYKASDVSTVAETSGWTDLNNGYAVTMFYRGAGHPSSRVIIAGSQDNGTQGHTPGNYFWDRDTVGDGDGTMAISDPTDSTLFYGARPKLQLFRATRSPINNVKRPGVRQTEGSWKGEGIDLGDIDTSSAEFICPYVLDPSNANVMLAGGVKALWRSTNIKDPKPKWIEIKKAGKSNITAIAIADTTGASGVNLSNLIVIGLKNGEIWKTSNANIPNSGIDINRNIPQWTQINNGVNANRRCENLTIDPNNTDIYYACFGGYESGNLWKTTNGGANWQDISSDLPKAPIYAITIHPQNNDWIYIATEVGLFASEDGGSTWSANNEGPANVCCKDLFWLGTTLVCVTSGRGIFQIDLTIRGVPETLIATDIQGGLYAMDGRAGAIVTKTTLPDAGSLTGIKVVEETQTLQDAVGATLANSLKNTGYLADDLGNVFCVDTQTLNVKWTVKVSGSVRATPELWLHPDNKTMLMLVSSSDGKLTAFDLANNHTQVWSIPLKGFSAGGEIWENAVMDNWVYLSSKSGLFAVRLLGGTQPEQVWSDTTISALAAAMSIANILYVPTEWGLKGYDARTGDKLWKAGGGKITSKPVWCMGAVVFGNEKGKLFGVDGKNGNTLFKKAFTGSIVGLAADDNLLYFVDNKEDKDYLYKFSVVPGTGNNSWTVTKEWQARLRHGTNAPPVIVDTESKLYITTTNNHAKCFNTDNGSQVWNTSMDNASFAMMAPVWPGAASQPS